MKRIRVESVGQLSGPVVLAGEKFHHLVHVLRSRVGETVEVFDGQGRSFEAKVASIETDCVHLSLGAERNSTPLRPLYLLQGLPKSDKLETILQKATELGASGFLPIDMVRSVARIPADKAAQKTARFQKIVEEAARQCGRTDVPTVWPPGPLSAAVDQLPGGTQVWVLDEEETSRPLSEAWAKAPRQAPVALVIGPEGGLDESERVLLRNRGASCVTLGPRILRTETASLAALSVVLHLEGQLG